MPYYFPRSTEPYKSQLPGQINGERIVSLTNCVKTTGFPYAREWTWTPISYHIQKPKWIKWIKYLNKTVKTVKFLEENISIYKYLHDLGLGKVFSDMTQAAKGKRDKFGFIKIKTFMLQWTPSKK